MWAKLRNLGDNQDAYSIVSRGAPYTSEYLYRGGIIPLHLSANNPWYSNMHL
jgi:hypothetical protein